MDNKGTNQLAQLVSKVMLTENQKKKLRKKKAKQGKASASGEVEPEGKGQGEGEVVKEESKLDANGNGVPASVETLLERKEDAKEVAGGESKKVVEELPLISEENGTLLSKETPPSLGDHKVGEDKGTLPSNGNLHHQEAQGVSVMNGATQKEEEKPVTETVSLLESRRDELKKKIASKADVIEERKKKLLQLKRSEPPVSITNKPSLVKSEQSSDSRALLSRLSREELEDLILSLSGLNKEVETFLVKVTKEESRHGTNAVEFYYPTLRQVLSQPKEDRTESQSAPQEERKTPVLKEKATSAKKPVLPESKKESKWDKLKEKAITHKPEEDLLSERVANHQYRLLQQLAEMGDRITKLENSSLPNGSTVLAPSKKTLDYNTVFFDPKYAPVAAYAIHLASKSNSKKFNFKSQGSVDKHTELVLEEGILKGNSAIARYFSRLNQGSNLYSVSHINEIERVLELSIALRSQSPSALEDAERLLQDSKTRFFVGDHVTLADLVFWEAVHESKVQLKTPRLRQWWSDIEKYEYLDRAKGDLVSVDPTSLHYNQQISHFVVETMKKLGVSRIEAEQMWIRQSKQGDKTEVGNAQQGIESEAINSTNTRHSKAVLDLSLGCSSCPNHPHLLATWVGSNGVGMCYNCANNPTTTRPTFTKSNPFVTDDRQLVVTEPNFKLLSLPAVSEAISIGKEMLERGKESSKMVAYAESTIEGGILWLSPKMEPILETAKPFLAKADSLAYRTLDNKLVSFTVSGISKVVHLFLAQKSKGNKL